MSSRRFALPAAAFVTAALGAGVISCNVVLGLGDFKNCPQDPGCGGSGGGTDPTCTDGVRNGAETDVDCGGSACARCADGKSCDVDGDCAGGMCSGGMCSTPSCMDKTKDGSETDVDCGGPACEKCGDGKGCGNGSDCASKVCVGGSCLASSCSDALQNGQETDTDCGGPCSPCGPGKGCAVDGDCAGGICGADKTCTPTCTDGVKDQDEADIDCGGSVCAPCPNGGTCSVAEDCESGICTGGSCASYYGWAESFGNANNQTPSGLTVDAAGNMVLTGGLQGTVDFGGTPVTSAGGSDAFVTRLDKDGNQVWSKVFGDAYNQQVMSTLVNNTGIVVAGTFNGKIGFGGSTFDAGTTGAPLNFLKTAMFLAKLDTNGGHVWSTYAPGDISNNSFRLTPRSLVSTSILLGTPPSVLVGGYSSPTTIGSANLTPAGMDDVFVASFNSNGVTQWVKSFGDGQSQYATSVSSTPGDGGIIVGGYFSGSITFGGSTLTSTSPNGDIFVTRLNGNGGHVWSKSFAVNDPTKMGTTVTLTGGGNLCIVGRQTSGTDFGGGPTTGTLYLVELDLQGNHLWSKGFDDQSTSGSTAYPIQISAGSMGGVVVSGSFDHALDLGGGALMGGAGISSMFVARFDEAGNHIWSRNFGTGGLLSPHVPTGMVVNPNEVYLSGFFRGSMDFGGPSPLGSIGQDIFVAKLLLP